MAPTLFGDVGGLSPTPTPAPASTGCEETYGFFPCSTSLGGSIVLIMVYGQTLLVGELGRMAEEINCLRLSPRLSTVPSYQRAWFNHTLCSQFVLGRRGFGKLIIFTVERVPLNHTPSMPFARANACFMQFAGANMIGDGSELLLEVMSPGLIGGLVCDVYLVNHMTHCCYSCIVPVLPVFSLPSFLSLECSNSQYSNSFSPLLRRCCLFWVHFQMQL